MESSKTVFECHFAPTELNLPLGLKIKLDGNVIFQRDSVDLPDRFSYDFDATDGEHTLEFEMFGKNPEHTTVDADGNILRDSMIHVGRIMLDDVNLDQIFSQFATYTHDFNGSGNTVEEKFYGNLGCNGTVSLKFTAPVFLWLLENM